MFLVHLDYVPRATATLDTRNGSTRSEKENESSITKLFPIAQLLHLSPLCAQLNLNVLSYHTTKRFVWKKCSKLNYK